MRPIPACASSYRRARYEEMGCGRLNEALRWQAKELDREHDQILARVKSQVGVTESFESSLATTLRHNSADAASHKTLLTLGLHAAFCSVYVRACMCVCMRACRRLPVRSLGSGHRLAAGPGLPPVVHRLLLAHRLAAPALGLPVLAHCLRSVQHLAALG